MRPRDDDSQPDRHPTIGGSVLVVMWLLAALLFAALPATAGVVVACSIPGLGGARPGISMPAVAGALGVIVVAGVVIGERPVRLMRALLPGRPRSQQLCAELVVFVFLAGALHVILASTLGAVVAAAVACTGYGLLEPLLRWVPRGPER